MRIFVFEYTSGGGLLDDLSATTLTSPPSATDLAKLAAEGEAMVSALGADFAAIPEFEVVVLRDHRLRLLKLTASSHVQSHAVQDRAEFEAFFDAAAARADLTVVIAPECEGVLLRLVKRVAEVGGRILGPGTETVQLAGDKHALVQHLLAHAVPAPIGCLVSEFQRRSTRLSPPLVLKPRDGAGSLGLRRFDRLPTPPDLPPDGDRWRIEQFCPGLPASVAVLCGPTGCVPLAPCQQILSGDGQCQYLGGRLPLAPELAERARRLAVRAIETLPAPRGYLGVDLVLGDDVSGADDVVIEINPRLTTSYVGLRAATRRNLAAAMLDVVAGDVSSIEFDAEHVQFDAQGGVFRASQ